MTLCLILLEKLNHQVWNPIRSISSLLRYQFELMIRVDPISIVPNNTTNMRGANFYNFRFSSRAKRTEDCQLAEPSSSCTDPSVLYSDYNEYQGREAVQHITPTTTFTTISNDRIKRKSCCLLQTILLYGQQHRVFCISEDQGRERGFGHYILAE
jgi:hypothetical protein